MTIDSVTETDASITSDASVWQSHFIVGTEKGRFAVMIDRDDRDDMDRVWNGDIGEPPNRVLDAGSHCIPDR